MAEFGFGEGRLAGEVGSRELRRTYHDRIGTLRERSRRMLRCSIAGTAEAARVLGSGTGADVRAAGCSVAEMQCLAAEVDAEVVSLLALESTMARDLRVILASRDVTQIGLLCVGLCVSLAERVERAGAALRPELSGLVGRIARGTEDLMGQVDAAWAGLDDELAADVERWAAAVRILQTEFLTSLLALEGVPMDAAIDLAMTARAFERLVDHAVEIAERVHFAVHGAAVPPAQQP